MGNCGAVVKGHRRDALNISACLLCMELGSTPALMNYLCSLWLSFLQVAVGCRVLALGLRTNFCRPQPCCLLLCLLMLRPMVGKVQSPWIIKSCPQPKPGAIVLAVGLNHSARADHCCDGCAGTMMDSCPTFLMPTLRVFGCFLVFYFNPFRCQDHNMVE